MKLFKKSICRSVILHINRETVVSYAHSQKRTGCHVLIAGIRCFILFHNISCPINDPAELIHVRIAHISKLLRSFLTPAPASAVHKDDLVLIRKFIRRAVVNAFVRNENSSWDMTFSKLISPAYIYNNVPVIK